MSMKFEFYRKSLIRFAIVLLVLAALPFSFELILLIDIGGLDLAITFMMLYLGTAYRQVVAKWDAFKQELRLFVRFVSELYMFQPRIFLPHVAASSIVVILTSSALLACLFWIPLMYVSSGFIL